LDWGYSKKVKASNILEKEHLKIASTHLSDWTSWKEETRYQMRDFAL